MGPDCTDFFFFFFKEQLPHVGFRFCFTSAVMSPGCLAGIAAPARNAPRGGRCGEWGWESEHPVSFLCSVRNINQVIALTSLPRNRRKLPLREQQKLFTLGLQIFCLLTLVLFIVHDYGQLGCHFFQIPV